MNKIKGIKLKSFALTLLFLFMTVGVHAQESFSVSGKITDDMGGLPYAIVTEKGKNVGVVADENGFFQLKVSKGATLVFSSVGYQSKEAVVNSETVNMMLAIEEKLLDEVVVIGYGKTSVKDLTSSIKTIRSDEIKKAPDGQVIQGLQGKVAGLQIVSNGAPGNSPEVRIRGIGSFNAASPLYVVDGMFFDNIDFLNNSDIASVSILKDASAAAIYGQRASNGVILIETHTGTYKAKASIRYDGYYGIQVPNIMKMANAEQYVHMVNSIGDIDVASVERAIQMYGRSRVNPNLPNVNTDWYKEISRIAPIQNHAIDISGGGESAVYSVGVSFFEQDGILDSKNSFKRFNMRSKIDYDVSKRLKVGANFIWNTGEKYSGEESVWRQAYYAVPILPKYHNGNYANAKELGYRGAQNPLITLENSNKRLNINKLLANLYAQISLIPDKLSFKTTLNQSFEVLDQRDVFFPYYVADDVQRPQKESSVSKNMTKVSKVLWDNVVSYDETIGKHKFSLMGGSSYEVQTQSKLSGSGLDIPYKQEEQWYIDKALEKQDSGDGGYKYHYLSYFGRLSYNFDNKYLLHGTIRADGSQKYQQKWGYFPAVGAGWVITEENFLKDNTYLNFLKLRGGWGQLGNNSIGTSSGSNTTKLEYLAIDDTRLPASISTSEFS